MNNFREFFCKSTVIFSFIFMLVSLKQSKIHFYRNSSIPSFESALPEPSRIELKRGVYGELVYQSS